MPDIHLRISDDVAERLRVSARESGKPMAAIARQALGAWLADRAKERPLDLALAENHEVYLAAGDVVSVAEIAQRTSRPVSTIQTWRRRYTHFPEPISRLAAGPLWNWDEVAEWVRRQASGELRRRRHDKSSPFPADLPGADIVDAGLRDIAMGKPTAAAALVSMATGRLQELGVEINGPPVDNPADTLYELVERQLGEGRAHSRYNAMRRRLSSFLRALAVTRAQAS